MNRSDIEFFSILKHFFVSNFAFNVDDIIGRLSAAAIGKNEKIFAASAMWEAKQLEAHKVFNTKTLTRESARKSARESARESARQSDAAETVYRQISRDRFLIFDNF